MCRRDTLTPSVPRAGSRCPGKHERVDSIIGVDRNHSGLGETLTTQKME